jgi:hypothetical protein
VGEELQERQRLPHDSLAFLPFFTRVPSAGDAGRRAMRWYLQRALRSP